MKQQLHRIWFHVRQLQSALDQAHDAELIVYEGDFKENAPCWALYELERRVEKTTKEQVSKIIHREIRDSFWKKRRAKKLS